MAETNRRDRDLVLPLVLIAIGIVLLLPGIGFGWLIGVALGVYLIYLWYMRRQRGVGASPWLLAIGAVLLLQSLDNFLGFRIPFLPTLLIAAGIVYLIEARM